jgi:tRNA threonylcarbamoyladenosine biosynthesis protein TsaE
MEFITENAQETQELGERVGASLVGGEVLALVGALGAGKTTFVQGLAKGLGVKKQIVSPTFIIVREYEGEKLNLYHVDLYRLEGDLGAELGNLGVMDAWGEARNVVVIEWAEKVRKYLPKGARWVNFENLGEERRKVMIDG